jgi:peptidoglycan-N-acetylglucosamine deacetylase
MARHLVCLSFDFDALSIWVAMGQTTPTPISRGEFGAVGVGRILKLLDQEDILGTFFIPGQTILTYPSVCREIHAAGHEIAHHGFEHVSPVNMERDEELAALRRGNEVIADITGEGARGYRSPAWDLSGHSIELLLAEGFVYDSSMMAHDFLPYQARNGDEIGTDGVYRFGESTELIELPVSWSLDDFPHFEYFRGGGLKPATGVLENWIGDFDYMRANTDRGVLTYTCHPFVIGRGHRMLMLENLIHQLKAKGAGFVTAEGAVAEFRHAN